MPDQDEPKNNETKPPESGPNNPPDRLSDEQEAQRKQSIADIARQRDEELARRHEEMRLDMMRSVVTEPLLSRVQMDKDGKFDIIIALNELFEGGVPAALKQVAGRAKAWNVNFATVSHYVFACLTGHQILELAEEARKLTLEHGRTATVIYRIWEDSDIGVTLTRSLATVKADAAQRAFQARGEGIVWAVLDSGIDRRHPHFQAAQSPFGPFNALDVRLPVEHVDFTPHGRRQASSPPSAPGVEQPNTALEDDFGHGTHVAGIIAGWWHSINDDGDMVAGTEMRDEQTNEPVRQRERIRTISGVAPKCKLVSVKVVADRTLAGDTKQVAGQGKVSWVLMAIDRIQQWNQYGKRLLVHGVNMSLGYDFDPRWFACGHSPICVEANRLVKSGVAVVVSAGNSGYSSFITASGKAASQFSDLSISDPGNAELAVTVGSTHKEMPHTYGVSYFSSRGPTGDGRLKPDLLAPGERIVSCAAGSEARKFGPLMENGQEVPLLYCEQSGTSMAAPHVSGAIAAFLSVRPEFVGQPERVKEIIMANTIDLRRDRYFQGAGLLDLMKVLQAV